LSIAFLVTVPVILVLLMVIVYLFSSNRWHIWPWADLNAMNATILYSTIDSKYFREPDEQTWTRASASPFHVGSEKSHVRPRYDRNSHSYSWITSSE
jgi:hypothetical protein